MQHLTFEELARLVDEAPLPHEAAHVRDCLVCRRELDELREQTALLGRLDDPEPAPAAWHRLEAALLSEGLMQPAVATRRGWSAWSEGRPLLRIAAALVLFLLGGATGAALWSHRPGVATLASGPAEGTPVVVRHPDEAPAVVSPPEAAFPAGGVAALPAASSGARLASTGADPRPNPPVPASVRRAERDLAEAEGAYIAALQRYAAIADPASGADPATRMAALERMISTTSDALERTPDDPVINAYHLAAVRERDTLRRQLAGADKDWF
jgi:hypothetical protein